MGTSYRSILIKMARKFIREVSCNDTETADYYRELARKNEVIIEEVKDEYVLRIYKVRSPSK